MQLLFLGILAQDRFEQVDAPAGSRAAGAPRGPARRARPPRRRSTACGGRPAALAADGARLRRRLRAEAVGGALAWLSTSAAGRCFAIDCRWRASAIRAESRAYQTVKRQPARSSSEPSISVIRPEFLASLDRRVDLVRRQSDASGQRRDRLAPGKPPIIGHFTKFGSDPLRLEASRLRHVLVI